MQWIPLLIWSVGFVIVYYPVYSALLSTVMGMTTSGPDTEDKVFAVFISGIFSLAWPLILVGLAMYLTSHRIWVGHWIPKWLSKVAKRTPQDAVP